MKRQTKDVSMNAVFKFLSLDSTNGFHTTEDAYREYILIIRSSLKRQSVFLKRASNAVNVNQYNKKSIVRHRANHDVQPVVHAYACACYITSYMTKSNASMSILLKNVQREYANGDLTNRQKLQKLANKFQNCSEVSAQEAVFTLLSMPLATSSRETIFINTYRIEERTKILKNTKYLEKLHLDSTKIFREGVLIQYKHRPISLEEMCLAEFASFYSFFSKEAKINLKKHKGKDYIMAPNSDEEDDEDDDFYEHQINNQSISSNNSNEILSEEDDGFLVCGNGYIKKRNIGRIIRYKRYNRLTSPADYFRVELMLYHPWRDEKTQVENASYFDVIENRFNKDRVVQNKARFEAVNSDEFDLACERIQNEVDEYQANSKEDYVDLIEYGHHVIL